VPELVCAADDPRWPDERRRGVTASEIPAIMGLSPYESEYSLWCKKTGLVEDVHQDSDRLRLGRELEPLIVRRWEEAGDGLAVMAGLYRSSARPWQMATPDRLVWTDDPPAPPVAVLEVKSWADAASGMWDDGPPPAVRAQVLWQMDTMDVATGHVGVLFLPSGEFRYYMIEHSREGVCDLAPDRPNADMGICRACIEQVDARDAAREFLKRVAGELPPPSPDGSLATLAALRARYQPFKGKEAEIDADLWDVWQHWKNTEDEAGTMRRANEALIREQAGEATVLTVAGVRVATRVVSESQVKAHTRHNDYIRRATRKEDD
jgi:putative phage-type endonuclease